MAYVPLNVRALSNAVYAWRDAGHTMGPGRWGSHPRLGVVLLTVPAFGPWDDRAATSRSTRLLGGSLSYGTRRRAAIAHTRRCHNLLTAANKKPNAPPASRAQGGASKLSRLEGSDL